jgi:FkbM family methyltransferase
MLIDFNILKDKYGITTHGVIHVGMHKAEEYPIYKNCGVEEIIFVEANRDLAHGWVNDDPHCHVVHAAVSDKEEIIKFHITNNGESSSILELGDHAKIYPHIVNVDTVEMKTTTLDTIIERVGVYKFVWNVLNLDIQGAELKAMKGLTNWDSIEAVFTEVNYREMYKGCGLEPEVTKFLEDKGFEKVEEDDTGCGWGDALYIKKK